MRLRVFVAGLIFASLLYIGCLGSTSVSGGKGESLQTTQFGTSGLPQLKPVSGTGPLVPSKENQFTFAVFGDSQGQPGSTTIKKIFQEIHDSQTDRPAFAFSLGDIVKGKDPQNPTTTLKKNFTAYLHLAKTAGVPVFNAPGNHEMDDGQDVPSVRMHKLYEEIVAPLYGAFDYGNSRFIALNTEDVPPEGTHPPSPPLEFSYLGQMQLDQLDKDLKANEDKTHIFIMMHYPIKPRRPNDTLNPESLKKLTQIIGKYDNISYVLASHEHLYYNPQDPQNVTEVTPFKAGDTTRYLISGGAGAWLDTREDTKELAFYHYLMFEVDGEHVYVKINRVDE